jgi:hypothetical protein
MRISTVIETPEDFTVRVAELLKADTTHVYFDTSFLMWLTLVGDEARSQFKQWAATLGERTHIPLWSMHEYHRHHTMGTLRANLVKPADELMNAAKAFQKEVGKYSDQPLLSGQSEATYQDSVAKVIASLKELSDVAKRWDYDRCAADVIDWMNSRVCQMQTVFQSMATLEAKGTARYTQDMPPGFLDRCKEDAPTKGSNRYGDLLFWEEVIQHARTVGARTVIIVTRDRKEDWFARAVEPDVKLDWKRVKAKWLPVPSPHPTLAFELKIEAKADLVLLDELYLGALLWKFDRPNFERLVSVAIAVAPGHFERVDPPLRPVRQRALKRNEPATIGIDEARKLFSAALKAPAEHVTAFLGRLDQDAPAVDEFIEQLGADALETLSKAEIANFTRLLHDRAKQGGSLAVAAARKLLELLDVMSADTAAASYLGFLCSAYLLDERPLSRPNSPFLEEIFAWQVDTALPVVLRTFAFEMKRLRSAVMYFPDGKNERLALRVEHDAEQHQDPVLLTQVYVKQQALLVDGEIRPEQQLRTLVNGAEATVREIVRALSSYYGLPVDQLDVQGAKLDDRRLIPELFGLREFSRFDQDEDEPPVDAADEGPDDDNNEEDEADYDPDVGAEEE